MTDVAYKTQGNEFLSVGLGAYDDGGNPSVRTVDRSSGLEHLETMVYDSAGRLTEYFHCQDREPNLPGGSCTKTTKEFDSGGNAKEVKSDSLVVDRNGETQRVETEEMRFVNALQQYYFVGTKEFRNGESIDLRTQSLFYDDAGNLVSMPQYRVVYDAFGRPARVFLHRLVGQIDNGRNLEGTGDKWKLFEPRFSLPDGILEGGHLELFFFDEGEGRTLGKPYPITGNSFGSISFSSADNSVEPFDGEGVDRTWSSRYKVEFPGNQEIEIANYFYDGLGRRTVKIVMNRGAMNGTHRFVYEGFQIIEDRVEVGDGGVVGHPTKAAVNDYYWGSRIDEVLRVDTREIRRDNSFSDTACHFLEGVNGEVLALGSGQSPGRVEETYDVSLDGLVTIRDAETGAVKPFSSFRNAIVWQGHYLDTETGFMWARARYYSPALGRFLQGDPLGAFADSAGNPYTFAGNNPVLGRDPSGLVHPAVIVIVAALVVGTYYAVDVADRGGDLGDLASAFATGALVGGASAAVGVGVFGALGGGFLAVIAAGSAESVVAVALSQHLAGQPVTLDALGEAAGVGAVLGAVLPLAVGGVARATRPITQRLGRGLARIRGLLSRPKTPTGITNKFPDDPLEGKIFGVAEVSEGKITLPGRPGGVPTYVDFVVTLDKKLVIGSKHSLLANQSDVLAAGHLKIIGKGLIRTIDNLSGHYRPSVSEALSFPKVLRGLGLDLRRALFQVYKFSVDEAGLITGKPETVIKRFLD